MHKLGTALGTCTFPRSFQAWALLSVAAWTQLVHICEQVSFQVGHSNFYSSDYSSESLLYVFLRLNSDSIVSARFLFHIRGLLLPTLWSKPISYECISTTQTCKFILTVCVLYSSKLVQNFLPGSYMPV